MYKVYIIKKRKGGSEVLKETKTDTHIQAVAEAAFWALRNDEQYQNKKLLLLMTENGKQLNAHWFDRSSGDDEYVEDNQALNFTHE